MSTFWTEVVLEPFWAGGLRLPTGRLVACDPFVGTQHPDVLDVTLTEREYDVVLSVASNGADSRVALATLLISSASPVMWQAARARREASTGHDANEPYVYGADSGSGCFTSPEAARDFNRSEHAAKLVTELERNYTQTWHWACLRIGPVKNMVVFASGFGGGRYASHIGLDSEGRPCCIATDFRVLDDWGVIRGTADDAHEARDDAPE